MMSSIAIWRRLYQSTNSPVASPYFGRFTYWKDTRRRNDFGANTKESEKIRLNSRKSCHCPASRFLFRFVLWQSGSASINSCQVNSPLARQPAQKLLETPACCSQPRLEQTVGADGVGPTKIGNGAMGCGAGLGADGIVGVAGGSDAAAAEPAADALAARR
jgi:hypothetical protein